MSFLKNVSIYAIADILGAGIGLITSPIATRLLTQEQYGALPLLSAVWAVVALLQYGGMDWAFPFFRSQQNYNKTNVLVSASIMASISGLIIWLLFFIINMMTPWLRDYAEVSNLELGLFIIGIFPGTLLNWYLYILRYENQAIAFARISLIGRTFSSLIALPAMALVDQEMRLTAGLGAGALVSFIAIIWALRELKIINLSIYNKNAWSGELVNKMIRYGILLVPGGVIYSLSTIFDRLLVGWYLGPKGNAILGLTASIGGVALLIKIWFARAWDPKMVEWIRTVDADYYLPRLKIGIKILILVMIPLPLLAIIWIEPLIHLLYAPEYAEVAPLIPTLILSGVVSSFSLIAVGTVLIANTARWHLPIYSIALILNVIIGIFFIPMYGVMGAIIGTLVGEVFILFAWIFVGIKFYANLRLEWLSSLLLIGIVALVCYGYQVGILIPEHPNLERMILSMFLFLIFSIIFIKFQPIKSYKGL